jgi:hypothetical protein
MIKLSLCICWWLVFCIIFCILTWLCTWMVPRHYPLLVCNWHTLCVTQRRNCIRSYCLDEFHALRMLKVTSSIYRCLVHAAQLLKSSAIQIAALLNCWHFGSRFHLPGCIRNQNRLSKRGNFIEREIFFVMRIFQRNILLSQMYLVRCLYALPPGLFVCVILLTCSPPQHVS